MRMKNLVSFCLTASFCKLCAHAAFVSESVLQLSLNLTLIRFFGSQNVVFVLFLEYVIMRLLILTRLELILTINFFLHLVSEEIVAQWLILLAKNVCVK